MGMERQHTKEVSQSEMKTQSFSDSFHPDKPIDVKETGEKLGGSYKEVFVPGEKDKEVHHMPAKEVSPLSANDGPCIKMDKADHRQTASCGNSKEARAYRAKQKELIEQGKFKEAMQMDIDDIRSKFGDKYDEGIKQCQEYANTLDITQGGKNNGE